ncbi:glycoprotein hormone alpha-2-like [Sycon ciliatum]|uniref:glycoprotein hormone alpha-2-like n=1 Tax=Sycon ciliatum TaxID=27933 RepID=UPI0020AADC73
MMMPLTCRYWVVLLLWCSALSVPRRVWTSTDLQYSQSCNPRIYTMRVTEDGCQGEFQTESCAGTCPSSSQPSEDFLHNGLFTETCKCCEPTKIVHSNVSLVCSGTKRNIRIPRAEQCTCRPCGPAHSVVGPGSRGSSASKLGGTVEASGNNTGADGTGATETTSTPPV